MAQVTKFTIDPNLSGIQLRTQASEMLTALSTLNSGDLEPVNPTGGMLWLDTTNNILKIRDKTNTAWLDFASVNDKVIAASTADSLKLGGLAADKYALKSEASDGLKIGSYLLWSSDRTTPAGFLPADGRRLQKSEYIELFDVIGYTYGGSGENFNLPKFNDGKFIRATGGNAASLGISQGDAIRNIKGGFGDVSGVYGEFHNPTGAFTNNQPRKKYNGGGWTEDNTGLGFDASRAVPVANENRPYNMSVIVLIKVKNVFESTNIDKSPYATEIKAGIVKLKNSITGNLSDTAVSEKAAKEYTDVAKAQISSQLLGISQTLQDVTAQRQIGVTYTNKTGRPIYLTIMCLAWTDYTIKIGDVSISFGGGDQGRTSKQTYYGIVPNDVEYSLTRGGSFYWWELR
jgi:tail collar domain protein